MKEKPYHRHTFSHVGLGGFWIGRLTDQAEQIEISNCIFLSKFIPHLRLSGIWQRWVRRLFERWNPLHQPIRSGRYLDVSTQPIIVQYQRWLPLYPLLQSFSKRFNPGCAVVIRMRRMLRTPSIWIWIANHPRSCCSSSSPHQSLLLPSRQIRPSSSLYIQLCVGDILQDAIFSVCAPGGCLL